MRRLWRRIRTASAFALFGGGGLVLAFLLLPVARSLSAAEGFDLRAQRWIQRAYRVFIGYMATIGLIRVERAEIPTPDGGGRLIVANHPTLIDTALLVAGFPQADCIAKAERAEVRVFGPAISAANYIRRETGSGVVEEAVKRLAAGRTLVVFPEGTRTPEGAKLGRFQRGAAHVALRAGVPIYPIVITARPRTLMKGQKWHDVPDRTLVLTVGNLAPLDPKDVLEGGETISLAARRVTEALRERFLVALETTEDEVE
jgi:1-acyl-sn-glycerol-3-phosphate acyltransferase